MKKHIIDSLHSTWPVILGNKSVWTYYLPIFFFTIIAVALIITYNAMNRDKRSSATPYNWSWKFFWGDTLKRGVAHLTASVLLVFVLSRWLDINTVPLMIGVGFGVSIGANKIIGFLINNWNLANNLLTVDRSKLMEDKPVL